MRLFAVLLSMLSCSLLYAAPIEVPIKGKVVDEYNQGLAGVSISLKGKVFTSNTTGDFTLLLAKNEVYQLSLSKKGFYAGVQTFSHFELTSLQSNKLLLSPITLVKKTKGRTLLSFGGDVMMGRRYWAPKFNNSVLIRKGSEDEDTKSIVRHIKPYMSLADYAAVNLETQLSAHKPTERAPKSVTFFSPPQTLDALAWAGIDYVTLGNNHVYDYLDEGLNSTLDALKNSPIAFSGAGLDQEQALKAHRIELNDTSFSMLGFVGWEGGFSPNQTANINKGGAAFGSMKNITDTVKRESALKRTSIVQYHGSQEYAREPTMVTEQRLKSAIDVGADLAIAHHPHVTQGFELYKGKLIAYSMGNFIFDQYFYATPYSFMLNVWMDGDKFHRAEIVPIYLKGYKPTPATGLQRSNVLKRLTTLSKKRGVTIGVSGGHGVIVADQISEHKRVATLLTLQSSLSKAAQPQTVFSMPTSSWDQPLSRVSGNDKSLAYRLGTNLANGSAFESFDLFSSNERGWNIDQNNFSLSTEKAVSGDKSMKSVLTNQGNDTFAMTNFRRVYKGGNPMTVQFNVNATLATKVRVYWQGRKNSDKFSDALANGEKHLIGDYALSGSGDWQLINTQFNTPRVGYRSVRILLEFENTASSSNPVYVDDVAFIQWNSAFNAIDANPLSNELTSQSSFIEFNRPLTSKDAVTLSFK
jgi:poly-gamma-glutamate capsule biosynthesis protein CapA/YwtB (metallophosphatase superfamily)